MRVRAGDFPEGHYRFEGKTTKGANLRGEERLSHIFPKPAAFEYPRSGQRDDRYSTDPALVCAGRHRVLRCRDRANRLAYEIGPLLPGSTRGVHEPMVSCAPAAAYTLRWDRAERRQPVLSSKIAFATGRPMNVPRQKSIVKMARDEPRRMYCLLLRNGDSGGAVLCSSANTGGHLAESVALIKGDRDVGPTDET